jgi:hypothetical protein
MGYWSKTDVATFAAKNDEKLCFCSGLVAKTTSSTHSTLYKKTHDFSDISYLKVGGICYGESGEGGFEVKIYVDSVLKATHTIASAGSDQVWYTLVDCTSLTGNLEIEITWKSATNNKYTWCKNLTMCNQEA